MNVLSAGIVPILRQDQTKYLLLRSGGYWDFPKGLVNEGEDPLDSAIRELEEETGLKNPKFTWGKQSLETAPYGQHKKIARYYLGEMLQPIPEIKLPINPELGHPEHDEFRWCSYQEAKKLLGARVGAILQWAYEVQNV